MGAKPLEFQIKGKGPTLLNTEKANALIELQRAMVSAFTVKPDGIGKLIAGDRDFTLDFNAFNDSLNDTFTDLYAQLAEQNSAISVILTALQNASITVICNANGTITVTLTLPGINPPS